MVNNAQHWRTSIWTKPRAIRVVRWLAAVLVATTGVISEAQDSPPQSVYTRLQAAAPATEREVAPESPPAVDEEAVAAAVGPDSLTERVGAPWHANEVIGPIHADRLERIEFSTPALNDPVPFDNAGWSSSFETLSLWNNSSYASTEDSAAIGARLTLGKRDREGSGVESRFATLNASNTNSFGRVEFEQQRLELDLTQRVSLGDTSVTFGVGPRLARYQVQQKGDVPYYYYNSTSYNDARFLGGGVGIGVEFDRILYRGQQSEFSMVGHARYSWLYGGFDTQRGTEDGTLSFREVAGGVEWRRRWGEGDLVLHSLFEVQDTVFGVAGSSVGVALGIGYSW